MRFIRTVFGWIFGLVFAALAASMLWQGVAVAAALLGLLALVTLPPIAGPLSRGLGRRMMWATRLALVIVITALAGWYLSGAERSSIYDSAAVRTELHAIYDAQLAAWPVEHESLMLETSRGPVHVIAWGDPRLPPVVLLHASGVSSWSWKYNAEGLGQRFRLYAVDLIGDAGKSEYADLENAMSSRQDLADHYAEVMDLLDLESAAVIGASEGGFIASTLALDHPDRVDRLVLLAPMGYANPLAAFSRITFAQLFPFPGVQDATFRWAFSDASTLVRDYADWFPLVMTGTFPAKVAPMPFSPDTRRQIAVPVLAILGARDNVAGNVETMRARVDDIVGAEIEIIDAGHLLAAEAPDEVNSLIIDFLTGN